MEGREAAAADGAGLFALGGDGLAATVSDLGATLVALHAPDRHGELADIVLGFDSLAEYASPGNPYFGGIIGRCANRIAGARFALDGEEYALAANEGRHHLHGGRRGFDRRVWTVLPDRTSRLCRFKLRSPEGEEGYPGTLDVEVAYVLDRSELRLVLEATTSAPTLVNLTSHAYFNLGGPRSPSILDHELQVLASRTVVVDDELIPTGELAPVDGTPFDFRSPRLIRERIGALEHTSARGYDVCFALDAPALPGAERGPVLACRLRDPGSGRILELETTEPGIQLYSGNRLDAVGKGGRLHRRWSGLCLEAQRFPDAVHHPHFPATVLRPGERYRQTTVLRFLSE